MSRENKDNLRLPLVGEQETSKQDMDKAGGETSESDQTRRESGVFLSPDKLKDAPFSVPAWPFSVPACPQQRQQKDSGYATSSSSSVFYVGEQTEGIGTVEEEEFHDLTEPLLDSGTHTNSNEDDDPTDTEDDLELSSVSTDTLRAGASLVSSSPPILGGANCPVSSPMSIPGASELHSAHNTALMIMDCTPPRCYITQSSPPHPSQHHGGHRYSTGSLSNISPVIINLLNCAQNPTHQLIETGLSVTHGLLRASASRAEIHRTRTFSGPLVREGFSEEEESASSRPMRDRSKSAPQIACNLLVQKKCADELRKISDEFFEDFPKTGKANVRSRAPSQTDCCVSVLPRQPSSYPGTCRRSHRSWWWQSIIQNLSPNKRDQPAASSQQPRH